MNIFLVTHMSGNKSIFLFGLNFTLISNNVKGYDEVFRKMKKTCFRAILGLIFSNMGKGEFS